MTSLEMSNAEKETELKKESLKSKSSFTLYRNRLLLLIEEQGVPRTEVNSACRKMDSYMESSMEVMSQLSDIYMRNKQLDKAVKIVNEMENLDQEFHSAYETVWKWLDLRKCNKSSVKSMDTCQRTCSVEKSVSESFRKNKKSIEQTVSQDNINEPEFCGAYSIGEDLWRQLKRNQLPIFTGDKWSYRNWKAAFMACVDTAPATGEYKLLRLRQCLSGEALNVIENLGHSAAAYEAAKERLEPRYGGKRRQIAVYLEDLDKFQQIRPGNTQDLEQFADLLEIAIINLKETGHHNELGDGFLYGKLRTKLTESMLAKFHRWIFESQTPESVEALKTWVFQESLFQTIASETVHGITGTLWNACRQSSQASSTCEREHVCQRTFFGEMMNNYSIKNTSCQICGRDHKIWSCQKFMEKHVSRRWDTAKRFKLCFRCLGDGHRGKSCQRSRPCGQNGCHKLHHVLLHRNEDRHVEAKAKYCLQNSSYHTKTCHSPLEARLIDTNNFSTDRGTSGTEGNYQSKESQMQTQDGYTVDSRGLPTIPVLLIKGDRTLKVDNGAIKPCVNADMAAELEHQSQKIVSERNCVLHIEDKTAHLIDARQDVETTNFYGGGLHRLEQQISSNSNRDFNT